MILQLAAPVLAFVAVVSLGGAVLSMRRARRSAIQGRLRQAQAPPPAATQNRAGPLAMLLWAAGSMALSRPSNALRAAMAGAGFHSRSAADVYLGTKNLLLLLTAAAGTLLIGPMHVALPIKVCGILLCAVTASFLPNMVVHAWRSRRREAIRKFLPDAMDLLEVCVSSGMGLDQAWNSVTGEIRRVSPLLADEMALTNLEIHLGSPRPVAMRNMFRRTGVDELSSFVALLVQTERFGTSIATALLTFAENLREQRTLRAQERAEKMAVKLLFPMVLFIFPAVLIVTAGPAFLRLYNVILSH